MLSHDLPIGTPVLGEAIDRPPLIVTPTTLVTETLALMSQVQSLSCLLPNFQNSLEERIPSQVRSSCVLVMEAKKLLGIFTERDLVRLIAAGWNFERVKIGEIMTQPVITLTEANFQDIFAALFLFRRYRIRHLPIVDEQGHLVGVISHESLRSCLRPTNLLKLRRVSDVMTPKVIQAAPTEKVLNLAKLMAEHRVSCVVIKEEIPEDLCLPVGIVTERDLLQFQTLGLELSKVQAHEVMSTPLFLLTPEDSLWIAHQEMEQRRVRRLVVSWNWGLGLGIVTQTSLLRVFDPMEMYGVIETLQQTVQQLETEKVEVLPGKAVQVKSAGNKLIAKSSQLIEPEEKNSYQSSQPQTELNSLLSQIQQRLYSLVNDPEMLPEKRQNLLSLAIADVEGLKKLLKENSSVI